MEALGSGFCGYGCRYSAFFSLSLKPARTFAKLNWQRKTFFPPKKVEGIARALIMLMNLFP